MCSRQHRKIIDPSQNELYLKDLLTTLHKPGFSFPFLYFSLHFATFLFTSPNEYIVYIPTNNHINKLNQRTSSLSDRFYVCIYLLVIMNRLYQDENDVHTSFIDIVGMKGQSGNHSVECYLSSREQTIISSGNKQVHKLNKIDSVRHS